MSVDDFLSNEVRKFVFELENGDISGGSGHLSEVSIEISDIKITNKANASSSSYEYIATVHFTKTIVTEFTIEPDNPPVVEEYSQEIYFGHDFKLKGFASKKLERSNVDIGILLDIEDHRDEIV